MPCVIVPPPGVNANTLALITLAPVMLPPVNSRSPAVPVVLNVLAVTTLAPVILPELAPPPGMVNTPALSNCHW